MKIIIAGDGKVGSTLAMQLSHEGHDLTLIDNNPEALESTMERYDVMTVVGNCASMQVLRDAGIKDADLLITATGADELNLLCCMTAHGMNPDLHTIARIRTPDYYESIYALRKMFALSLSVNPERQTAREIDRLLRYPGFLKREPFANGLVEIVEIKVDEGSPLKDVPLSHFAAVVQTQVLVCAAVRDGKAVTPTGDFVIREGDRLFVTASATNLSALLKNIGIPAPRIKNVVIIGGGRNCYYLTPMLLKEGINVKIIERDRKKCERLAEAFPAATVIEDDASTTPVLDREKIRQADALIAMTGLDELNIILSLYARHQKVPQVITKLGRAENLDLLGTLPVGGIVSPKELCCNTITRYVRAMENQVGAAVTVHSIADGQAEAIEFLVDASTKHIGEPLKNISLKPNILLASITHGRNIIIPNGDSVFQAGDRIVLVSSAGKAIQQLNDIFSA